ncbi:hypothetical protein B0T17DRAFT_30858 [Bombardia bombarda]|uniref:Uncharacterized protein n=1 Tax=Bombardia bombarda TaxID=252184 RepID=A0AA40CDT2_9PEZI|nr:hypothetical protein B0T17DRAFT_30858 [Bombardia bombarda]
MASPASVLSKTLQSISRSRIRELDSRRSPYETSKRHLLDEADQATDQRERLASLLSAFDRLNPNPYSASPFDNVERWLAQSRYDASIPLSKLATFESQIRAKLDVQSRKLDMAHLYSRLLTEWMGQPSPDTSLSPPDDLDSTSFEVVERQRQRLSQLVEQFDYVVFTPLKTSGAAIRGFLNPLFADDKSKAALEALRSTVASETSDLWRKIEPFNDESLKNCIKGLLREDLLSDEKRATLNDFLVSDVSKTEIADVLNMRFSALQQWHWDAGTGGIPVMPRAGLNGKYRIWADDDILQMLFVQYIDVKMCNILKCALTSFMSDVYVRDVDGHQTPSPRNLLRREYFFGPSWSQSSVEEERKSTYLDTFFLSHLPGSETSLGDGGQLYDDDNDDDDGSDGDKTSPKRSNIKQMLLRQLTSDMLIHRLRGVTYKSEATADNGVALVQTDLQCQSSCSQIVHLGITIFNTD